MLATFTMEVNIHMHILAYMSQHLTQQLPPALAIGIICGIELCQETFCTQNHLHYFRVPASYKRFASHALFIFCFIRILFCGQKYKTLMYRNLSYVKNTPLP